MDWISDYGVHFYSEGQKAHFPTQSENYLKVIHFLDILLK